MPFVFEYGANCGLISGIGKGQVSRMRRAHVRTALLPNGLRCPSMFNMARVSCCPESGPQSAIPLQSTSLAGRVACQRKRVSGAGHIDLTIGNPTVQ